MDDGLVLHTHGAVRDCTQVLILIVVDNGLVLWYSLLLGATLSVLILVVVDNGLVQAVHAHGVYTSQLVLILVVVNDGLVLNCNRVLAMLAPS